MWKLLALILQVPRWFFCPISYLAGLNRTHGLHGMRSLCVIKSSSRQNWFFSSSSYWPLSVWFAQSGVWYHHGFRSDSQCLSIGWGVKQWASYNVTIFPPSPLFPLLISNRVLIKVLFLFSRLWQALLYLGWKCSTSLGRVDGVECWEPSRWFLSFLLAY